MSKFFSEEIKDTCLMLTLKSRDAFPFSSMSGIFQKMDSIKRKGGTKR